MQNEYPHVQLSRRGRLTLIVLISAFGLVAAEGILSRLHEDKLLVHAAEMRDTTPVKIIIPQAGAASEKLRLPCNVTPWYQADIFSRVNGYLKDWYTDIGARVKAGQLLAVVETPDLDDQIQRAQANLATQKAKLELAIVTAQRWEKLLATDSVSRQETEEKQADEKAQQAEVNAQEAELRRLKVLQSFNHIVAPFDGVITDRNTDIGMLISNGSNASIPPLFKVADERRLRVYVEVPQNYADRISTSTPATITLPDRPGKEYAAKVISTSVAIHVASRTLTVELELANPGETIMPGAYGDVAFTLPSPKSVVRIPGSALLFRQGGLKVATVGPDNRVVLKSITVARDLGKIIEVSSGVSATDRIIDTPSDSIADGDRVQISSGFTK